MNDTILTTGGSDSLQAGARRRGEGRGSNFFLVDRQTWEKLWTCKTNNRLNLVCAFLVLSAGTGADHRLTKWSARACENYLGLGKPRAKVAIDELNKLKIISVHGTSRRPQYEMAPIAGTTEPIFLPNQLVTGLSDETPMLRRARETGDEMIIRMLIDLYGLVQIDATHGIPLGSFYQFEKLECEPRIRLTDIGVHAVWALRFGTWRRAAGEWTKVHATKSNWDLFWSRFKTLETIGGVLVEDWLFDGDALDAEPLYPIARIYDDTRSGGGMALACRDATDILLKDAPYFRQRYPDHEFLVMPAHHRPPALRGVLRLRVEADTPGRRQSFARRMAAIEAWEKAYKDVLELARQGRFDRPIRWHGF